MLISQKKKFIFIHIYKNAGTSVRAALLPFAATPWQRAMDRALRTLGISRWRPQPYPGHIRASELIELNGRKWFDSFFSFAIVRNPWDWQVSLYTFMLKTTDHPQHDLIRRLGGFDPYIKWRIAEEIRFQKDFVYSKEGELLVDFIGKFENLDADFQTVCSRIGISASLPKLNVSNTKPYRRYYTDETRELVRQAFAPDISAFNYEF